jgi:hypothetical protein
MTKIPQKFTAVALFAVAMAFLESAVVVYLRELYYPGGFSFPLKPLPDRILAVEIAREFATIIMLTGIGYLAGEKGLLRFAWFIFAFAVWDIFYYVFMYICLSWPASLGDPDILFLIPVPWTGPVWAPCLLCLLMIAGSATVIVRTARGNPPQIRTVDWLMLIAGAAVCITGFTLDAFRHSSKELMNGNYHPKEFPLWIFLSGFALMAWPVLKHLIQKNIHHEKA